MWASSCIPCLYVLITYYITPTQTTNDKWSSNIIISKHHLNLNKLLPPQQPHHKYNIIRVVFKLCMNTSDTIHQYTPNHNTNHNIKQHNLSLFGIKHWYYLVLNIAPQQIYAKSVICVRIYVYQVEHQLLIPPII